MEIVLKEKVIVMMIRIVFPDLSVKVVDWDWDWELTLDWQLTFVRQVRHSRFFSSYPSHRIKSEMIIEHKLN